MDRRTYLRSAGATGTLVLAGCLGMGSDDDPTILDSPDHDADSEDLAYPAYGQQLPEVTVPSPLHDRDVTTTEFVDGRHVLMTFVFTRCHGPCPTLTATLAQVQAHAAENGYADAVALLPVTFDPAYDTRETLATFSEERGADPTAANWQFLRPESHDAATEVVNDAFGVGFEKTDAYTEDTEHGEHDAEDYEDGGAGGTDDQPTEDLFVHLTLIILANRDGYVERAYTDIPQPTTVRDDLATVREGFE